MPVTHLTPKKPLVSLRALVYLGLALVIGVIIVIAILAAGTPLGLEAESGLRSGGTTLVADATASGGAAVKFATPAATSTPTPIPQPGSCPAFPSFPTAACTGYAHTGTTLAKVPSQATSGNGWTWNGYAVATTVAGTTISGLDISGGFEDSKGAATLKNSYVRCTGITDWCLTVASNALITDVEIGGGANGTTMSTATGVYTGGPNNVFRQINIHNTSDGMRVDGGTSIYDSYIHDLIMNEAPAPGAHSDGSQTTAGYSPILFDHDYVEGGTNDALFFEVSSSPITVNHTFLKYRIRNGVSSSFGIGAYHGASISITNNIFSNEFKGGSGSASGSAITNSISPATITGNTFEDGTPAS
jgi:hypothetical protein